VSLWSLFAGDGTIADEWNFKGNLLWTRRDLFQLPGTPVTVRAVAKHTAHKILRLACFLIVERRSLKRPLMHALSAVPGGCMPTTRSGRPRRRPRLGQTGSHDYVE
jgi:hypothetical protein